jgi:glycosyltransferase involved in cell wall biosynthesis
MKEFIGSVSMIPQEILTYQRKFGHKVDVIGESSFLKDGIPFNDNLKMYDIVCCYESDWFIHLEKLDNIKYIFVNYDSNRITKNNVTISNYWRERVGGWPKVVNVGITPNRTLFSKNKKDYILYLNTLARKKCCLDILKNIHTLGEIKVMGGKHTQDYWDEIFNFCKDKPNIELYGRHTSEIEKWETMSHAKCVVMAHNPAVGEESGCITQIEAKFAGTPVVALGKIFKETIIQGITGYAVDDWDDFKNSIENCKSINPYDCLCDGLSIYQAEDMAKKYISLYEEVLDGGW